MKMQHRPSLIGCKGTAAVEFALVGPIFLLLLLFTMQAEFVLWTKSAMRAVASQTARCVALEDPNCNDAASFANSLMATWGVAGLVASISVTVQRSASCDNAAGQFSVVTLSSAAASFRYFVPPLSTIVLTSSSCYPSGA